MPKRPPQSSAAARATIERRRAPVRPRELRKERQAARQAERRDAILGAALAEFSERGFAAARLEDVAHRAGVAKGTIYLYFRDKEALFQELIRTRLVPIVGTVERLRDAQIPIAVLKQTMVDLFVNEIFGTSRKDVIRLMIAEGARFPKLAEFYYREVLSRAMEAISGILRRAYERGELDSDVLARFPQLLGGPGMIAIIWSSLFQRFAPLDVRALMQAHVDLVLQPKKVPGGSS